MNQLQRVYRHKIVSNLNLNEIEKIIDSNELDFCGDYGLKNDKETRLIFSVN